ncbi:MAG: tripartite tricarboxylate transporter permease, partial [Pseudomonadota bacterium]
MSDHRQPAKRLRISFRDKAFWPLRQDYLGSRFTFWRGSAIGFMAGVLSGSGATLSSIIGYSVEKKVAKDPERLGKGEMRGL